MAKGMLGTLSLSEIQGPMNELYLRLSGDEGREWLDALNHFLRKEKSWPGHNKVRVLACIGPACPAPVAWYRKELELPIAPFPGLTVQFPNDPVLEALALTIESVDVNLGTLNNDSEIEISFGEHASPEIMELISDPESGWVDFMKT